MAFLPIFDWPDPPSNAIGNANAISNANAIAIAIANARARANARAWARRNAIAKYRLGLNLYIPVILQQHFPVRLPCYDLLNVTY